MALEGTSLDALLSALGDGELTPFKPSARYYEPMDCVLYLQRDVAYRADRVDGFLTLLWEPDSDALVGVKLKGFRWLFQRWQASCLSENIKVPDTAFIPLMKPIELALTARLHEILARAAEAEEADRQKIIEEKVRLEARYHQAIGFVNSMTVDVSELMEPA